MKNHAMMWRVLSLVVGLFAALSLTFAPVLAPNFNLAPVYADNDDDDDDDDDDDRRRRDKKDDKDKDDRALGGLNRRDARKIFRACIVAADETTPIFRPKTGKGIWWCAVVDRDGHLLLIRVTDTGEKPGQPLRSDGWRGSIEIAIAKAYTAVAFSTNDLGLTSRVIGLVARQDGPGSTDPDDIGTSGGVAPLFGIGNTNLYRPLTGRQSLRPDDRPSLKHHGIVLFAGGVPVYDCDTGKLLGAVGASGDGVDEDELVAEGAVTGADFCLTPEGNGNNAD